MPAKERGLRRRRNAGENGSGTRDIARDVLPPPEMLSGTRTSYENPWREVLSCLSKRSNGMNPLPRVKILDTVLLDGAGSGQAESFYLTDANGSLQRKVGRVLSLKNVEKELRSSAVNWDKSLGGSDDRQNLTLRHTDDRIVAMARTRSGEYLPLSSRTLHTIVKAGAIPANFECLYPFRRAKDFETTGEFANYQHQYILDDTGGGISTGTTHRRVATELLGGRGGQVVGGNAVLLGSGARSRSLLLSKNSKVNAEAEAAARSVVHAIERHKRCRVLRLDAEFVFDEDDNLWLVGVTSCMVAARPAFSGTSESRGDQQGEAAVGDGTGCTLATELRHRKHEADQSSDVPSDEAFSHLLRSVGYEFPNKGRASGGSNRLHRRVRATTNSDKRDAINPHAKPGEDGGMLPGDNSIDSSQGMSFSKGLWAPELRELEAEGRRSVGPITVDSDWAAPGFSDGLVSSDLRRDIHGGGDVGAARSSPSPLRRESLERFDSTVVKLDRDVINRIYGSTQVEGCRGDFCDFDVGKRVREEETHRNLVENMARAAGAAGGLVEELSPLRLKIISMGSEDAAEAAATGSVATAAAVRPGGRGPRAARHSDLSSARFDIPYKAVIQARQERTLVEAFLRRYARGESDPHLYHRYVDGGAGDDPYLVGGKYPGVYYRPVRVCRNCHMVYALVDEARARALRKVRCCGGGGGKRAGRQNPPSPRVGFKQPRRGAKDDADSPTPGSLPAGVGEGDGRDSSENTDRLTAAGDSVLASSLSEEGYENSQLSMSLARARQAMDAVSQGDISELRSFARPPAAVAHVASVVMFLLEGKSSSKAGAAPVSWAVIRAAMGRGDFFSRLRDFDPQNAAPKQMTAVNEAVERPNLDPAVVRPLSNAAGNLCLWLLGAVQAHRWLTGTGHARANTVPADSDIRRWGDEMHNTSRKKRGSPCNGWGGGQHGQPLPRQNSQLGEQSLTPPRRARWASPSRGHRGGIGKRGRMENGTLPKTVPIASDGGCVVVSRGGTEATGFGVHGPATAASPTLNGGVDPGFGASKERIGGATGPPDAATAAMTPCRRSRRRDAGGQVAAAAAQAAASNRLASMGQSSMLPEFPVGKSFACSDGRTRLPYRVCGDPRPSSDAADCCNFIVVHDFFDNVDKTEVLFRSVTRKHRGCRVLAFSYPGQAGTVFRVPPSFAGVPSESSATGGSDAARSQGPIPLPSGGGVGASAWKGGGTNTWGKDVPNNTFIAPRLHELLQHVHLVGEMSLATPFHLVGIGNGMPTAAAFALRYGDHPLYRSNLRSVVSINGFSSVDPQLAAVLHSSLNAFATLPPARPDLPVSFMSRYLFSDDYMRKVGRNLALGIYTAVANPVSLEGRHLLCGSALLHEDLSEEVGALGVPIVLLQSTEDVLVNPANVDPFLRGRDSTFHFWSHEFRKGGGGSVSGGTVDGEALDPAAAAIGSSVYGRNGLTNLLRALSKPRGTFVAWVRAGHEVCQEGKRAVVDLLDALAKPTPEHIGVQAADVLRGEAEGAATLGLYPSGEWVARVNKRGGGREAESGNDGRRPTRDGVAANVSSCGEFNSDGAGGDDAATGSDHSRRQERLLMEHDNSATATIVSPFPKDIMIPTLPAKVSLRNQAPNSSPIKRRRAASSSDATPATISPRRGAHHFSLAQSSSPDAFGVCNDKGAGGWRRGRRSGPRGAVRTEIVSCARDRLQRAAEGGSIAGRGRHRRPNVVWKEISPPTDVVDEGEGSEGPASPPRKGPSHREGDGDGRGRGEGHGAGSYSRSCFPTAAALHDNVLRPSPTGDATTSGSFHCPSSSSPGGAMLKNLPAVFYEVGDPWDLVKNSPSLELVPSNQLQRGNRRWVLHETSTAAGPGGVGEEEVNKNTSPRSTTAATARATRSACDGAGTGAGSSGGGAGTSPPLGDLLEAEASLESRLCEVRRRAAERLAREEAEAEWRISAITEEQRARSRAFAEEDRKIVADLESQLAAGRLERAPVDLQRAVEGADIDDAIFREGFVGLPPMLALCGRNGAASKDEGGVAVGAGGGVRDASHSVSPARPMPPLDYAPADDLPEELRRATDAYSLMEDAACDEAKMLRLRKAAGGGGGATSVEQFQRERAAAAAEAAAWRLTAKRAYRKRSKSELERARVVAALRFQALTRGVLGRNRARRRRLEREEDKASSAAATKVQAAARGRLARKRARVVKDAVTAELVLGGSALRLQRVGRGMLGRRRAAQRRGQVRALAIQRLYRGHLGRRCAARQREVLERLKKRQRAAVRLQAWWRCVLAVGAYERARATSFAAVEIQRCFRGVIGRKKARRRLEWERAEPGAERLKLGVRLIEDSKNAFEAQRIEIAALHTAGDKAAIRTSQIRKELDISEKELSALEREMHEIDHIEVQLSQLNRQRDLVQRGLMKAGETPLRVDAPAPPMSAGGASGGSGEKLLVDVADKEFAFALEMQIQIKRAEREKKRQELEADFRGVREEVERKRRELERVVGAIAEIEFTRERKTSELRRMQGNLMELLREQKAELDSLKERGVQLEVATATSAAAACATMQRAKDHEERSSAMYSQTEELMKFQFMSMSLSYFSSLNMLKTMRDINADTTTAAVTSSADAAAAAAASAAAVSMPSIKAGKTMDSVSHVVDQIGVKTKQLKKKMEEQQELDEANAHPFPKEVRLWSTEDVGHFLTTLGLRRYRAAFAEAAVDGDFLLALNVNDCADVLGVEHVLHSKKLFLAIDKLRPLTLEDRKKKASVEREESAEMIRGDAIPDAETVFSQVRNGRVRRLEDSLELGFPVDTEDEFGNTALMVACQNSNILLCEKLLQRGANVNHCNRRGNTPLHYAMAYDPQGVLGEMLISKGGDDTIANKDGMTCYDGLGVSVSG